MAVRSLLLVSFLLVPCLAAAHNGRDGAPPPLKAWAQARGANANANADQGLVGSFVDIHAGIVVKVDPKTGVRSYVQVGDIPSNPARAMSTAKNTGPDMDFWVRKEFERNQPAAEPAYAYEQPPTHISSYEEPAYGYGYGYGGYVPGYGGGGGRPGHGGGGGGNGNGGGGRPDNGPRPSPPPGPAGGGVGSPPPYNFAGVGAPTPQPGFDGIGSRRR